MLGGASYDGVSVIAGSDEGAVVGGVSVTINPRYPDRQRALCPDRVVTLTPPGHARPADPGRRALPGRNTNRTHPARTVW